ncbi:MAG: ATP-binding protein [Salaquimonas sp.]
MTFASLANSAGEKHHTRQELSGPLAGGMLLRVSSKILPKGAVRSIANIAGMTTSLSGALMATTTVAAAQGALQTGVIQPLNSTSILLLAIFGGAVSFALLSAFWLIRERARIMEENSQLRKSHSGIKASRDRMASLVEVDDQCVVLWDNGNSEVKVLGSLDVACGAPNSHSDFLAFGKWLHPNSATILENAIDALRADAKQFTFGVKTHSGHALEAQGRVSGGYAFVRFILLDGARQELAKISTDYTALFNRFALLENLFDKLPAPIWIKNHDGNLAYVNPAYAAAVEVENCDIAVSGNKTLFDSKERDVIESTLVKEKQIHKQMPVVVAGDRRTMETLSVATENGSCGIAIDRGDVEAVRTTLKHVIASHQQTFDHLGTAIAIFDENQKLQFYNSSFQQLWQLNASDLEGQPSNSHMLDTLRNTNRLPEQPDWKRWKEQQLSIYRSTETRDENWHLPDGRTLRVIVNPQNQGGASWVFENVTEELALKSNYNSLVRVQGETLDHLNEAVAVFGSDGKVRLTNPAFQKLWKFNGPQEVEGFHVKEISKTIKSALETQESWETICLGITGVEDDRNDLNGRLELNSGAIFDYHLVFLPEGQSMLTLADMTAAVNIERALKERNDALEESDSLKNRFIQHVSYELRAPLTSISGFAEILASNSPGKLNEKQSEYLEYITKSSDVLKALIDDILDLATIDAGAMELELNNVDVEQVIATSLEKVSEKLERFQLKANVKIEPGLTNIIADPTRLNQILINLLSNAINVSPDGGTIEIEVAQSGNNIDLSVTDQGPGIPEENQQNIFERFETLQGTTRKRGAGLGLSIVKSIAELHGGTVYVENAGKRGARFVCKLPLEPAADLQAAQ